MTLKHLMSMKNSRVLVKNLSFEGAFDLLTGYICQLENDISALQESYREVKYILDNGLSLSGARYAELEMEEIQSEVKEKSHQMNHTNSLLEDLQSGMNALAARTEMDSGLDSNNACS